MCTEDIDCPELFTVGGVDASDAAIGMGENQVWIVASRLVDTGGGIAGALANPIDPPARLASAGIQCQQVTLTDFPHLITDDHQVLVDDRRCAGTVTAMIAGQVDLPDFVSSMVQSTQQRTGVGLPECIDSLGIDCWCMRGGAVLLVVFERIEGVVFLPDDLATLDIHAQQLSLARFTVSNGCEQSLIPDHWRGVTHAWQLD